LATLDFDGGKVEFTRALEGLERIARQTMFAPESREAPVQVMGPLEAAGATFDAVWFLRGGDLTWPVAPGSSSLLPWQMKRELGMLGTDVTADREHARRMTERVADSAGMVVFSYAKETADGRQRRSPALEGLALEEVGVDELAEPAVERSVIEIETVEDSTPILPLPNQVIHGGAEILRLQAACGFRAFAERRLWATELESAELGMDARESGTVVHKVLELFWNEVKTQSALKAMQRVEWDAILRRCIAEALRKIGELSATAWDAAYVDMQRERLRNLLVPWLELELKRPAFEVSLSEKKIDDVQIGPLRLSVRVDRVDMVGEGEILIDYKTGSASPNDWLGDRPDAPQLPLYAVLSEAEQLQGVAFGLVRAGKDMGLKGYAASGDVLLKPAKLKTPSLEAQVEDWQRVLEELATRFALGDARVAPKRYPETCRHCAQRALCRLDVSLLEEDEGDAAEVTHG
jgi:probable DNA repair protein